MGRKNYLQQMLEEEDQLFKRVRNYIRDNYDRRLTIEEVAHETRIDIKIISKWVSEGKLNMGKPNYQSKDDLMTEIIKSRDEMIKELEKKK